MNFSRSFISTLLILTVQVFPLLAQTGKLNKKDGTAKLLKAKAFGISNMLVLKKTSTGSPAAANLSQASNYYAKQNSTQKKYIDAAATFGLGIGLDYGGIGGRLTLLADPHLGLFLGGGYALQGFGMNGGLMIRFQPEKKFVPTISGMYGYNASITIKNLPPGSSYDSYNKLYYGPSFGFGFLSKSERHSKSYWQFQIIIPIRSSEYENNVDVLKSNPSINIETTPPFALGSIGYHF